MSKRFLFRFFLFIQILLDFVKIINIDKGRNKTFHENCSNNLMRTQGIRYNGQLKKTIKYKPT